MFVCAVVSEVPSQSVAEERSCSGSSVIVATDAKMASLDDDNDADDDCTTSPTVCQQQQTTDDVTDTAEDTAADDDGPSHSVVFPARAPQHMAQASCPASPPSDVMRTSAEGRAICDGEEQSGSDNDNDATTST